MAGKSDIFPTLTGIIRTFIYIGLFSVWGVSIWRRIVQVQAKRYLITIAALMLFWMAIRTVKYLFVIDENVIRQLWYAYYIPMLSIPFFAVFVALSLGKSESYRLPKWTALLYIPTVLLILLVLTNDFHQLVFTFPVGATIWTDKDYGYNTLYWLVISYEIICAAVALITMLLKCRVPQSRNILWLPLVPFGIALVYGMLYVIDFSMLAFIAGDITVVFCLLFAGVFESCIQCGLIQSNTGYDMLFPLATISAEITDEDYSIRYSSAGANDLPKPILKQTEHGTVQLDSSTLLKGHAIRAGHIVWQEDITELSDAIDELKENREAISHSNEVERENYQAKRMTNQLREKNRLYDLLQEQTATQNELLSVILDAYYQADDEQEKHRLLAKAAVIGAYIKRRGNLVFLKEENESLPAAELALCFNESIQSLELMGVKSELTQKLTGTIAADSATRIYDLFEAAIEASLDKLFGVWIYITEKAGNITARMKIITPYDLAFLSDNGIKVINEDDTWSLTLRLAKGGGKQ